MVRLSKYLSTAGVTSRRGAAGLVAEGRVILNDQTVENIGVIIDENADVVKVDGTIVKPVSEPVYLLLNKPRRVMTTLHDPFQRRTVVHYLRNLAHRVYPVGRLDFDTEGVLMLCNDGELAYRLTHPRYRVKKVYEAVVVGRFTRGDVTRVRHGVRLDDGAIGRAQVNILRYGKGTTIIRLTLTEGRKREVKQLCRAVHHPVKQLCRVEFAGLTVRGLKLGAWRFLTSKEVAGLRMLVGL